MEVPTTHGKLIFSAFDVHLSVLHFDDGFAHEFTLGLNKCGEVLLLFVSNDCVFPLIFFFCFVFTRFGK